MGAGASVRKTAPKKWKHQDAAKYYQYLVKWLGLPTAYSKSPGGFAIWNNNTLKKQKYYGFNICFNEIILRDESIKHLCPIPHKDFLYTSVKINIPEARLIQVLKLSGSLSYDPLKNLLTARCGSLAANMATLKLATDIAVGNVDWQTVRDNNLYARAIMCTYSAKSADKTNHPLTKWMYCKLCGNLQKGRKLNNGYWPEAFPGGCPPGKYRSLADLRGIKDSSQYKGLVGGKKQAGIKNGGNGKSVPIAKGNLVKYPTNKIKGKMPIPTRLDQQIKKDIEKMTDYSATRHRGGSGGYPYGVPELLYVDSYKTPMIYL